MLRRLTVLSALVAAIGFGCEKKEDSGSTRSGTGAEPERTSGTDPGGAPSGASPGAAPGTAPGVAPGSAPSVGPGGEPVAGGTPQAPSPGGAPGMVNGRPGVVVTTPGGMVAGISDLELSLEDIRQAFDDKALPEAGVVLSGPSGTIKIASPELPADDGVVPSARFVKNYDVEIVISKAVYEGEGELGILIREGAETRVVRVADLLVTVDEASATYTIHFKASGTIDYQVVNLKNPVVENSAIYVSRPAEALAVAANAISDEAIQLTWGNPGGTGAEYVIVYSVAQSDVIADFGCLHANRVEGIPGTARSRVISALLPQTQYYFRICSKNSRFPAPDRSPGVNVTASTLEPAVPIQHIAYSKQDPGGLGPYVVRHALRSTDQWAKTFVASGTAGGDEGALQGSFSLNIDNLPSIAVADNAGGAITIRSARLVNGSWQVDTHEQIENAFGLPVASIGLVAGESGRYFLSYSLPSGGFGAIVTEKTFDGTNWSTSSYPQDSVWRTSVPRWIKDGLTADWTSLQRNRFLAYHEGQFPTQVFVTKQAAGTWESQHLQISPTGGSACDNASYPTVASSAAGHIYVVYYCAIGGNVLVTLATNKTGAWVSRTLDSISGSVYSRPPQVSIGPNSATLYAVHTMGGNVRVVSYDMAGDTVIQASTAYTVPSGAYLVVAGADVAVDKFGTVHVAYVLSGEQADVSSLNTITKTTTGWTDPVIVDQAVAYTKFRIFGFEVTEGRERSFR